MKKNYIIVTPVRDEETNIEELVQSVISQTIRPLEWIIVNDGSTDSTVKIIEKYLSANEWIKLIHKKDRGYYLLGSGRGEAFYFGFNLIKNNNWDYLSIMDGDVAFNSNYFQVLLGRFEENPKLGIASGKTFIKNGDQLVCELCPDDHVRGPLKTYRRKCWDDIGGVEVRRLWDTIDEMKAQKLGWETRSYYDLKIIHKRPIDARQKNPFESRYILGKNFYNIGYHPLFMCVKCLKVMALERPRILAGFYLFLGYLTSLLKRDKIYDKELAKFIRQKQLKRFNLHHLITYFQKR